MSKDVVEHSTVNQVNIVDIYWLLYPTMAQYTFFSSSHGIFTKMELNLGHKTHCVTCKGTEVIQCLLSVHSGIKSEINKRKISEKSTDTWRGTTAFQKNTQIKKGVSREILNILKILKLFERH